MTRLCVCRPAVMMLAAFLITGATASQGHSLDLLKLLTDKPWLLGARNIWNQHPQIDPDMASARHQPFDLRKLFDPQRLGFDSRVYLEPKMNQNDEDADEVSDDNMNDVIRSGSGKRSAVATALNAGRRRRQPAPALGKVVAPYVGVGVLNDMGQFFDSLRDNLEVLASMSPQQRATFLQETPSVVHAPSAGSGGGGGMRRLHALRPLRPTGNIRSYNRRSFVEADGAYPGANHHDPGLLWTGLGRR